MKSCLLTPAAGKRLIARAVAQHEAIASALSEGTIVIIAGTTNGYIAEELLRALGQAEGFSRRRFFRGIALPPPMAVTDAGRLQDESGFFGDVVIEKGRWVKGKTVFDAVDDLREGDVILKGANAVDPRARQAAILIGHPHGGTILAALQAVVGRRARLLLPVGLEKRVHTPLADLAAWLNAPGSKGPRLLPVPGEVLTEIEALKILTGVEAQLIAGGGVCGAEGAVWLGLRGDEESLCRAEEVLAAVAAEPPFSR